MRKDIEELETNNNYQLFWRFACQGKGKLSMQAYC